MRKIILIAYLLFSFQAASVLMAQVLARITIDSKNTIGAPVNISLDNITVLPDSSLILREVTKKGTILQSFQVGNGSHRFIKWILSKNPSGDKRIFELCMRS